MKKIISIIILFTITISLFKAQQSENLINEKFIDDNFALFSQKDHLQTSISRLITNGNFDLLRYYLTKLSKEKISYQKELQEAINIKLQKMNAVYNKLKYKDESGIQKVAPAFEWAENKFNVILHVKYSKYLNSMACPEVDNEKLDIKKDKRTIVYTARCLQSNYQLAFELTLKLFDKVTKVEKQTKERGETRFTIKKENQEEWERLLKPGERLPENSIKMY